MTMDVEEKPSLKITHITHNNVKILEGSEACGNETEIIIEYAEEVKHKLDMMEALPLFWTSYCFLVGKTIQVSFLCCSNLLQSLLWMLKRIYFQVFFMSATAVDK